MRMTQALKDFLVAKQWCVATATDAEFQAEAIKRLAAGELSAAELAKLTEDKPADGKAAVAQMIAEANAPLAKALGDLTTLVKGMQTPPTPPPAPGTPPPTPPTPPPANPPPAPPIDQAAIDAMVQKGLSGFMAGLAAQGMPIPQPGEQVTPSLLFGRHAQAGWLKGVKADQKKPVDEYDNTKSNLFWPSDHKIGFLRGQRLTTPSAKGPGQGRPMESLSRADEAVIGATFKWLAGVNSPGASLPAGMQMSDHDWQLVRHAVHEMAWSGVLGGENGRPVEGMKLGEGNVKMLLDDSVSGGIYAVPQILDDAIIQAPLLFGELFPLVDVINISQGRRIEALTMGRPTMTWGIPEGTAIPLFDTTGFIGALDTTIFPCVGSMQLGNDFEEDSPANIGQMVVRSYGDTALETLDKVIALGDGTTQPKGIFNTAGVTAVSSASGVGGPVAVGDLEGLMFGVDKKFRTSRGGNRNVFIGNEVTYKRVRGIPTGATYNTRAFGMNYGDYMALGFPYKIHPEIPNSKLAFVNMAWYQMWRRLGTQVKVEDRGQTLVQLNATLISLRMRFGGQMTLGGAAAITTDLEA